MTIYDRPSGYRLFSVDTYGPDVTRYRRHEAGLLRRLARRGETLVELGCGKGEFLRVARGFGMKYCGVDPCARYIAAAAAKHASYLGDGARLRCGTAERPEEWNCGAASLIFMPFNALGNVAEPAAVFRALAQTPSAVFLSVFRGDRRTARVRGRYYAKAGRRGGGLTPTPWGLRFQHGDFKTVGFNPAPLLSRARGAGLRVWLRPVGPFGLALVGRGRG